MNTNQESIAALKASGMSNRQIASAIGRDPRVVSQIMKGEKPYKNLESTLSALARGAKPGKEELSASRRTTKGGKAANVRKSTTSGQTRQGHKFETTRVKKGPTSLKEAVNRAAKQKASLRWNVNFKSIRTKSPEKKNDGSYGLRTVNDAWVSGSLPKGWSPQTLQDRIASPQEGDNWRAGDINGALAAIALEQNSGSIVSASGAQDFSVTSTGW